MSDRDSIKTRSPEPLPGDGGRHDDDSDRDHAHAHGSGRSSGESGGGGGYQEIPGNKLKLTWQFYVVWALLFIAIMWRFGTESRLPRESQLPAGAQVVLSVVVPDDAGALDALRRSSPPRGWQVGVDTQSHPESKCPAWSEWVNAYYHGAGGATVFEAWGKRLQQEKSKVRLLPNPVPRQLITFEQLHRLVATHSRVAPDLAFVPADVYEKLAAAGDLLPIVEPSTGAPATQEGAADRRSPAVQYGLADVRQAEFAWLRLLAKVAAQTSAQAEPHTQGQAAPQTPPGAGATPADRPEYLVILRTTHFPQAAREIAQQFPREAQVFEEQRQQAWNALVARAQKATAPTSGSGTTPSNPSPPVSGSSTSALNPTPSASRAGFCPVPSPEQLEDPSLLVQPAQR
ncbi:MAG: hypothetical protein IMX01_08375 [Limnochordaceae bacterium]|nr:hypothetical protein [Limnochordaceae bacterium]